MHILVVDDDIPTVEVIRTSLHWDLLGIDRVETAYDYTEAQNKICASQPDIIPVSYTHLTLPTILRV